MVDADARMPGDTKVGGTRISPSTQIRGGADHNVQQTLSVCDRAYIVNEGRILAEGTPQQLINNEMVRRVYLGSLFKGDEFDNLGASQAVQASRPVGEGVA